MTRSNRKRVRRPDGPTQTDEPTQPSGTIQPDKPTQPDELTKPDEPIQPDELTKPDEPIQPGEPIQPSGTPQNNSPEEPGDSALASDSPQSGSLVRVRSSRRKTPAAAPSGPVGQLTAVAIFDTTVPVYMQTVRETSICPELIPAPTEARSAVAVPATRKAPADESAAGGSDGG